MAVFAKNHHRNERYISATAIKIITAQKINGQNMVFTSMDYLNLLVCIPVIFWIAIGIRAHSNWIQSVFVAESKKIKQQSQMISEFGYGSLNSRDKLVAKKGLVFAYWEGSRQDQKPTAQLESLQSPAIFQLVNFSLVAGTSICLLMILSKGLFASLGLI
ncbi:hypothetical protein [Synechococcus sp. MU1625]|uniref:hypothetical protein n=1 Tax=Synechococcus sp. MU1625 TaxID=2508347 RepID=UPI001CF8D19A|nr:hypothetical protein [Synechococcus sp. MU1625]MCB4398396.1 hypothetical protein [Synechococcus sp. MU1625]